jgi:hypothetical protein
MKPVERVPLKAAELKARSSWIQRVMVQLRWQTNFGEPHAPARPSSEKSI